MEGRLFFLSLWCGLYAQLVRLLYRRDELIRKPVVTVLLNSLFWGTAAAMVGMLVASYTERLEQTIQIAVAFAGIGFIIGSVVGYFRSKNDTAREALLQDNLEWADTGFSAILLASVVMFFVVQAFKIPSGSMRMTFLEGDHLFVNKFIYGVPVPFTDKKVLPIQKVKVNDIVIFRFPAKSKDSPHYGKDFIKRCIALEGQKVQVINKTLYVDGVPREEPFKQHVDDIVFPAVDFPKDVFQQKWQDGDFERLGGNDIRDNFGPIVVPAGHIFVMGDNRDRSFDSRFWGPLDLHAIKGKAWILYWPFKRFRWVH